MNLLALATEFLALRGSSGILLDQAEIVDCFVRAARQYAAHGSIRSIDLFGSLADNFVLEAPAPGATALPAYDPLVHPVDPVAESGLPIKHLTYITSTTVVTVGEWSIMQPLAVLYVEREQAMRLEAARVAGVEFFGRSASEVSSDIINVESTMAERAFTNTITSIG